MALLYSNKCVMYGRFDGSTGAHDFANNAPLSGCFVPGTGKLAEGMMGRGGTVSAVGSASQFASRTTQPPALVKLDGTRFIVFYSDANATGQGKAKVGTVTGQSIAWGAESVFASGGSASQIQATLLHTSGVIVTFQDSSQNQNGVARYGLITGNNIAWGSQASFYTSFGNFGSSAVAAVSTSGFVVSYIDYADHEYGKGRVGLVTNGVVSFGNACMFSDSSAVGSLAMVKVATDRVVVAYTEANFAYAGRIRAADVVGTTLVWRTADTFSPIGPVSNISMARVGYYQGSKPRLCITYRDAQRYGATRTAWMNDVNFAWNTEQQFTYAADDMSVNQLSSDFLLGAACLTGLGFRIGGIDDNPPVANVWLSTPQPFTHGSYTKMVELGSDTAVVAFSDSTSGDKGKAHVVTFDQGRATVTQAGASSISSVGQSGVGLAFWVKQSDGGSIWIRASRGYTVEFYRDRIVASGTSVANSVAWSGASVTTLLNTINDGNWHFVVSHMKKGTGNNWGLMTSIDNAAYVNHGNQISGVMPVSASDSSFYLRYDPFDGVLDEFGMWFVPEPFSTYQVSGLYSLAAQGRRFSEYSETVATSATKSTTAVIYGPTAQQVARPAFIKADDLPYESSGAVFYHPLNDRTEWIKHRAWSGEMASKTAQIETGMAPDFSDTFNIPASAVRTMAQTTATSVAYMSNNVALCVGPSSTQYVYGPYCIRLSGNQIEYGPFHDWRAGYTTGYGPSQNKVLRLTDTTAMMFWTGGQYKTWAVVLTVDTDTLAVTSGAIYQPVTWNMPETTIAWASGYHGGMSICEPVLMSTSGDVHHKVLIIGQDTYVGNIQVYVATVSGTVIQNISPYKTVDNRIYDWKVKIGYSASVARLDETHAVLHYGNRNRMRIITLTPDGSGVTFGREITSMMPNNAKATELLALNETSGVVAVVGGATNIKGCLLPVLFGESGIIVPPAPPNGASWARMGIGGADNFQHTFQYNDDVNSDFRMAKLTETRFATFYNHTGSGHSLWIMENRPSGIFIVNSGQLTPAPWNNGTEDRATNVTIIPLDSSGVFLAWKRASDNYGVGQVVRVLDPTGTWGGLDVGPITAFSTQQAKFISAAKHGTSGVVLGWQDHADGYRIKYCYGSYSGTSLSFGTPTTIATGINTTNESAYPVRVRQLDANRYVMIYLDAASGNRASVLTVGAGGTVTAGSSALYCAGAGAFFPRLYKISPSGFGIFYNDHRKSRPRKVFGVLTVDGASNITFASGLVYDGFGKPSNLHVSTAALEETSLVVIGDRVYASWVDTTVKSNASDVPLVRAGRLTSDTLTWLNNDFQVIHCDSTGYMQQGICAMSRNRFFLITRMYESWLGGNVCQMFDVDYANDRLIPLFPWSGDYAMPDGNQYPYVKAARLSDTVVAVATRTVDQNSTALRLARYLPASGQVVIGPTTWVVRPSGAGGVSLGAAPEGKLAYAITQQYDGFPHYWQVEGFLNCNSSGYISPESSNDYSSVSGDKQFMLMGWAKHPTTSGTTVNVGRGIKFQLVGNKIRFGTNTVEWETASVSGVMGALNDGQAHFVIVDVQHEDASPGSWRLRTSIDGGPWVDHGLQTSGTEAVPTSDGNAKIEVINSKPEMANEAWLDDVYLYAGPPSIDLTDTERLRAYSLGAYQHTGLENFGTFGLLLASSGNAYLKGPRIYIGNSGAVLYQTYDRHLSGGCNGKPHEYLTGRGWDKSSSGTMSLLPGIAGQAGYQQGWGTQAWYEPTAETVTAHPRLSGTDPYYGNDWTVMSWWTCDRGIYGPDLLLVGQGDGVRNSIGFEAVTTSGVALIAYVNGSRLTVGQADYPAAIAKKSFFVGRIEFYPETCEASGFLSLNGEPWRALGPVTIPYANPTTQRYGIRTSLSAGPGRDSLLDETVLWQGIDRFTNVELWGLYQLGVNGQALGDNEASVAGPFPMSGGVPVHFGYTPTGTTKGFLKGPTFPPDFSGLIFYQGCEQAMAEYNYPDATWTTNDAVVSGLVGSGIGVEVGASGGMGSADPRYIAPSALTNATAAFWVSGVQWPSGMCHVGWRDSETNPTQAIGVKLEGTSGVRFVLTSRGAAWESNTIIYPLRYNPTLFVTRVEYSGGQPHCYLSVDGSGWVYMGAAPLPWFNNQRDDVGCTLIASPEGGAE